MTQDDTLPVSAVICAYTEKRWGDILKAVASLQAQTQAPAEILLVIDHNDALLARVRAEIPGVRALPSVGIQGLSGARNTGIAAATGPLIAFLDDDAVATPGWLARLAHHCADPHVLGAGGWIEPAWDKPRPRWFPPEFDWVVGCSYRGLPTKVTPVRNTFGGCLLMRKEVFETVGGFRDGIGRVGTVPLGDEDTELCIRAQQHWPDRVLLFDPDAHIAHRVPASRAHWGYLRSRCYAEGLSKALVASFVGTGDGLATERSYALRTLPAGVRRGIADTVVRRDIAGLARAAAITVGFTWTVAGYLKGTYIRWRGKEPVDAS